MGRIHNFNAGPAALPEPVLERARDEMLDWRGRGLSVLEMSHRGAAFREIAETAETDLRRLAGIGDDYVVLFLQGGATMQFAGVPLNLLGDAPSADYVVTGAWAQKARGEAARFTEARVAASGEADEFRSIPARESWDLSDRSAYVHVTLNETIGGVEYPDVPDVGDALLVADVSSDFLSKPLDISRFACLYAGAQKNIGPAGLTLVIVRKDLLDRARDDTPMVTDYAKQAKAGSMLNTPPCFSWYMCGLVFRHLLEMGGLEAVGAHNALKAGKLYAFIDGSDLYRNPIDVACRSAMNVPFLLTRDGLDESFLAEAEAAGLHGLKGHRSVGGMRASIYNAVSEATVDALIGFMRAFEQAHA